jgi:hypothetical protein
MPGSRLSAEQSGRVAQAAEAWARSQGFASAAEVPFLRAQDLIGAVADRTSLPADAVRDALLARASAASEAAARGRKKLGTGGGYQGTRGFTPLRGDQGARPLAAMIDARTTPPARAAIDALDGGDKTFRQLVEDFRAQRIAITDRASPKTLRELAEASAKLLALYDGLDGTRDDAQAREEILRLQKNLLSRGAREKGVFVVKAPDDAQLGRFSVDRGPVDAAPALGASTVSDGDARYRDLGRAMGADGEPRLDRTRPTALGRTASLGVDAGSGEAFLYEFHGAVKELVSIEDLVNRHRAAQGDSAKVAAVVGDDLASMRALPEKALARLTGEVSFVSLREGDEDPMARVVATRWYQAPGSLLHRRVICDGPFKGVFLDELVSRMASEGPSFTFDPKRGAFARDAARKGEAFVTTAKVMERGQKRDRLLVHIPFENGFTEVRQALRRLSELDPAIRYEKGSKNTAFYFPPESYKAVRDVLRGMVLSQPALQLLEGHFADLVRIEQQAADANLGQYTAKALGGFRDTVKNPDGSTRKVDLSHWQKKTVAWLEAREFRGVVALDTGMGKTLAGIAAMQRLVQQGEKGRFLVVCPPALRGNFTKEIHKFMTPEAAERLVSRMDVLSYPELTRAMKTGQLDGKPFDSTRYAAVLFDEAQALKSLTSSRTKAALALKNDRKICLTASPMENSPMEAYVLASVASGVNLADRVEGKEHRWRMRKFKELYCETLGGRILGVKQDVELLPKVMIDPKHNLYQWVRGNIFFADKELDQEKLPPLKLSTETLTMPKDMETEYRKRASRVAKVMRGMVSLLRDKGVVREYVDDKGRTRREINPLARDKRINHVYGVKLRGVIEALNDLGNDEAKVARAAELLWKKLEVSPRSRAVLFSDSSEYVLATAKQLSTEIPGKLHAAALGSEIRFFQNGKELKELGGHALPFKQGAYRPDPSRPAGPDNREHAPGEWQQFVLNEVIGKNPEVVTSTLHGPTYQTGQNLQWADTGFHLDRDHWNRENTKQREARLWRKGQTQKVDFFNLDWVFRKPSDELDRTLDEIKGYHELIAEALFRDVIEAPGRTGELGEEWSKARDVDDLAIDPELLALNFAPTAARAGATGVH